MAAEKLTIGLQTTYPIWVARQLLEIVADRARLSGYEVTDNFVNSFTIELTELPEGGQPGALKAALKDLGALPSVSVREHGE